MTLDEDTRFPKEQADTQGIDSDQKAVLMRGIVEKFLTVLNSPSADLQLGATNPMHGADSGSGSSRAEATSCGQQMFEDAMERLRPTAKSLSRRNGRLAGEASALLETLAIPLENICCATMDSIHTASDSEAERALQESMVSDGLVHPIVVGKDSYNTDGFVVIDGFRRLKAAAALGWKDIRATVVEFDSIADAYLLQTATNTTHATVSPYELALRAEFLSKQLKVPMVEIAKRVGFSVPHLYNLRRYLSLPEDIVDDWRARHPLLTLRRLEQLTKTFDSSKKWQAIRAAHALSEAKDPLPKMDDLESTDAEPGTIEYLRPSSAKLGRLRDQLLRARLPSDPRTMILAIVDYCRGATNTIPSLNAPPLTKRTKREQACLTLPVAGLAPSSAAPPRLDISL
jgi:ParB/RepB/Spo0J family partition protein